MPDLRIEGADVLGPQGFHSEFLGIESGVISDAEHMRSVDLSGFMVLPGIVDLHGDAFERHVAPRRGAMKEMAEGLVATEAELAANGITTAMLAQFVSWEGGVRSLEFADQVFAAIRDTAPSLLTDVRAQLRLETHMLELYENVPHLLAEWQIDYVVFNDHLPHERLSQGRHPQRMVGQALKAGRSPEAHFKMLMDLHARQDDVAPALDDLCTVLAQKGVRMGSHDDGTPEDRTRWRERGVRISEFPETLDVAEAAKREGDAIVLGAPNIVRGGSHKGNVSAIDLVTMGLCDAIASDYHYPSPRRAALLIANSGILPFVDAWALVSSGPAAVLGLSDRGILTTGRRADIVILDKQSHRVAATMVAGRFSHLSGTVAERLCASA